MAEVPQPAGEGALDAGKTTGHRQLNRRFADIACEHLCPGDTVCIDDHQHCPAPALKGAGLLNACAFFFHLPFPSAALLGGASRNIAS
ncbi:hypothetical protein M8494_25135 [Serratia ureilytica]